MSGTIVSVEHKDFGTVFACLVNSSGSILSPVAYEFMPELTTDQILAELYKFGFDIEFKPENNIPGDQLEFLMTVDRLGYQKIRTLCVYHYDNGKTRVAKNHVVLFNVVENVNENWLNNTYACSEKEFTERLRDGSCMDLCNLSEERKFNWGWLTYVANIFDILRNNSDVEMPEENDDVEVIQ